MKYALYIWGVYYIVMLIKGAVNQDLQVADQFCRNSLSDYLCDLLGVFVSEASYRKNVQKKISFKKGCNIKPLKCFDVKPALKHLIRSE